MSKFDTDRLHGLRRWSEFLRAHFQPWWTVRETIDEGDTHDAVWRVEFPDGTHGRIRITDEALRLDGDRFQALVDQLEEANCLRILWTARRGGIRIYPLQSMDATGRWEARPAPTTEPLRSSG